MLVRDLEVTEVMFRKYKDKGGEILAVFPYEVEGPNGELLCYARLGQHGLCDYGHVLEKTRPAKPEEYESLRKELKSIGYKLKIVKKRQHRKAV